MVHKSMLNILQINKFFYPRGGSETSLFSLMDGLTERGHAVVPFSMHHTQNIESVYSKYFVPERDFQHDKTLSNAARAIYSTEVAEALEKLLAEVPIDIAHVHNISYQLTPSIFSVLKKRNIPIVSTLHDYQLICPNYKLYTEGSPCERCFVHKYWNAVIHKCVQDSFSVSALAAAEMFLHKNVLHSYDAVDRFIAPSRFMKDIVTRWGIASERVVHIPHGIDTLPITHKKRGDYILYAGRLEKEKGVLTIIRASQQSGVRVRIVGSGTQEKELKRLCTAENILSVEFLGQQNPERVRELMGEAAACVVPSEWYENAPMVIYEALASGTAVIGSRIGGIPELIVEGRNGLLCAPGDAKGFADAFVHILKRPLDNSVDFQYTSKLHIDSIEALYASCL